MADIQPTDQFVVNRSDSTQTVDHADLMASLQDSDLLIVNRDETVYTITAVDLKDSLKPELTLTVVISTMNPKVGSAVTVTPVPGGGTEPFSYTYQWKRDGSDIEGATGASYTPVDGDADKKLLCTVVVTDDDGDTATADSPETNAVVKTEAPPSIDSAALSGGPGFSGKTYTTTLINYDPGEPAATLGMKAKVVGALSVAGETSPITEVGSTWNESEVWSSSTYCSGKIDRSGYESTKAFSGIVPSIGSSDVNWISDNTGTEEKFDVTGLFPNAKTVTIYYFVDSTFPEYFKVNGNVITQTGTESTCQKVDVDVDGTGFNTIEFKYGVGLNAVFVDGALLVDQGINGAQPVLSLTDRKDLDNGAFVVGDVVTGYTTDGPPAAFAPVIYTGTSGTQDINCGFAPDLVWIKSRTEAKNHNLFDTVRGADKVLASNDPSAESGFSGTGYLTAFNSNGFTVGNQGSVNADSQDYVAWCWTASGSTVTNNDGTIESQVRAGNGFSVVTYTGTGVGGDTIGHGLGATPKFVIVKTRNTTGNGWRVYHESIGNTQYLQLDLSDKANTYNDWNNTTPTSSVIALGAGTPAPTNESGNTYVAYCFAETDGSSFGSYTGTGSNQTIDCGFDPAFVMIKCTSSGNTSWIMYDTARNPVNPANLGLEADLADAERTFSGATINFVTNGFEVLNDDAWTSKSGESYVYMAFAGGEPPVTVEAISTTADEMTVSGGAWEVGQTVKNTVVNPVSVKPVTDEITEVNDLVLTFSGDKDLNQVEASDDVYQDAGYTAQTSEITGVAEDALMSGLSATVGDGSLNNGSIFDEQVYTNFCRQNRKSQGFTFTGLNVKMGDKIQIFGQSGAERPAFLEIAGIEYQISLPNGTPAWSNADSYALSPPIYVTKSGAFTNFYCNEGSSISDPGGDASCGAIYVNDIQVFNGQTIGTILTLTDDTDLEIFKPGDVVQNYLTTGTGGPYKGYAYGSNNATPPAITSASFVADEVFGVRPTTDNLNNFFLLYDCLENITNPVFVQFGGQAINWKTWGSADGATWVSTGDFTNTSEAKTTGTYRYWAMYRSDSAGIINYANYGFSNSYVPATTKVVSVDVDNNQMTVDGGDWKAWNQSQEWSASSTFTTAPEAGFDGNTSTYANVQPSQPGSVTFTITNVTSIEVYTKQLTANTGYVYTAKTGDGDKSISTITSEGWQSLYSGPALTMNGFETTNTGYGGSYSALRVNGKTLVNPTNQSQVWSDNKINGAGFDSSSPATQCFDGLATTNGGGKNTGGTSFARVGFTFSPPLTGETVFLVGETKDKTDLVWINGANPDPSAWAVVDAYNNTVTVNEEINTFEFAGPNLRMVTNQGERLVDKGIGGDSTVSCTYQPGTGIVSGVDVAGKTVTLSTIGDDYPLRWVANRGRKMTMDRKPSVATTAFLEFSGTQVTGLTTSDPGYKPCDPSLQLSFSDPAPSGSSWDTELPTGTTMQTRVFATNDSGTADSLWSNTVIGRKLPLESTEPEFKNAFLESTARISTFDNRADVYQGQLAQQKRDDLNTKIAANLGISTAELKDLTE